MENSDLAKIDIVQLLNQIYGAAVAKFFEKSHQSEGLPIFVHNSFVVLQQNMGKGKASEQIDSILSRRGIGLSSYE